MSYEYDASYRIGIQRIAEVAREAEIRSRIAERIIDTGVRQPKDVPFWVWFRNRFPGAHRIRPASAF